jgi:hypothetical protein
MKSPRRPVSATPVAGCSPSGASTPATHTAATSAHTSPGVTQRAPTPSQSPGRTWTRTANLANEYTASTVARKLTSVSSFYSCLVKVVPNVMQADPAEDVARPGVSDESMTAGLDLDESARRSNTPTAPAWASPR